MTARFRLHAATSIYAWGPIKYVVLDWFDCDSFALEMMQ